MERHRIGLRLHMYAGRVVVPGHMQGPDVKDHDPRDHEGHQVVQGEEAVQCRVVDREAPPQPGGDGFADDRQGAEEVGDHHRAMEAHLPPRKDIAHEGRGHHQEVDDAAQDPEQLPGRLVGPVVQAAEHVSIDRDEEHRGAVGVHVADQPAIVHVTHDALDGGEGVVYVRHIVHGQHDPGRQLDPQTQGQDAAEGVPIVQVLRGREVDEAVIGQPGDRETGV